MLPYLRTLYITKLAFAVLSNNFWEHDIIEFFTIHSLEKYCLVVKIAKSLVVFLNKIQMQVIYPYEIYST